ncbi:MAG: hypothetical protein ACKVS5_00745 [Parvularculaceae bacterium]
MKAASRTSIAPQFVQRLLRNAIVVVAVTAIFGFKAAERSAMTAAAPPEAYVEIASR